MTKPYFIAAKSRSNRPGWSITFRHPLRLDTRGRPGRKVRRGLGTDDEALADELVGQMNELLSDQSWWNANRKAEAATKFAKPIVAAFFDDVWARAEPSERLRDSHLPLPGREEGYSRVLFVGTTGAGKTTLLRQLIGSDPDADRFPSTAPAKTTIADIEVIAADGEYSAIVTFFSEFQIQAYIEECILDAALAVHSGAPDVRVAQRFLNHRDQKFRLSYILGPWGSVDVTDDLSFEDDDDQASAVEGEEGLPSDEIASNRASLEIVLGRVSALARSISRVVSIELGLDQLKPSKEDHEAFLELLGEAFEAELHRQEEFHELVQDVLDLVRSRFQRLDAGHLHEGGSGWPVSWTFETSNRDEFIRQIRWFSSNYWPHFGRLLTPLVDGIRVRGPLYPAVAGEKRLVLIDGQGLGHTPDIATSVTTHITRRFDEVDVILIVDNAQQPMQAAPLSLLKAAAISGNDEKVAIAFTHFDQIKGQNLPTIADKRAHVMASVVSALASLQDTVGTRITRSLERNIENRCFMLGGTHRRLSSLNSKAANYMTSQLESLISFCVEASREEEDAIAEVTYDPIGISFAIQDGAAKFIRPWKSRLGLASYGSYRKEHWTRVKALNRRIAGQLAFEYDNLRPVADLHTTLMEALSRYLDSPLQEAEADGDHRAATRARRIVAARLQRVCHERIVEKQLAAWRVANDQAGVGSTNRRALMIAALLDEAAPIPDAVMTANSKEFLRDIAEVVTSAVTEVGGRFTTRAA